MSRTRLAGALVGIAYASIAYGDDARQIVQESMQRAKSNSQRYEGLLEVAGGPGKITTKRWTYERIGSAGNSKSVIRFTAPAEVKGVALLVVNHPERSSDQWMWTPATGRERRIALQDRSTRFFGTDFSFEDLEERDVDQYDYKLLGEETVDGAVCWKIESRPRSGKRSQYTHSLSWVRKDNYVVTQIESYRNDQVARRLRQTQIEKVQGIWTPRRLEMTDLKRNSRTTLTFEKFAYNVLLDENQFTVAALRRE